MNFQQIKESIKDKMFFRRKRLQSRVPLPFPMVLNIELTNKCTENCIWCPRDAMSRPQGFMGHRLFEKIIDETALHPKLRRLYIHWMGEPLLHPEFLGLVEYAKLKDIAEMIVIATNGVLLSREKIRKLIELEIDELYISIDAATPEKYTEVKNTNNFNLIKSNIEEAAALKRELKAKLPFIRVKFLETDANIGQKDIFRRQWKGIADSIFFEKDLSIWNGKSIKVNKNIGRMGCYLRNYGNLKRRYPCDRLWYLLAVHWDGKVSPCVCDWDGENIIGDLNSEKIGELWYNEALTHYRHCHINGFYEEIKLCSFCTKWGTRNMGDWLLKHKKRALSRPQFSKNSKS